MPDDTWVDDPTILDDDPLWRRVPPWHIVPAAEPGTKRVSSAAFEDDDDGQPMSVVLGKEALSLESVVVGLPDFGVVEITAGLARQRQQKIVRDPLDDQPAHALVAGRKTDGTRKAFMRAAAWVLRPPGQDENSLP